MPTDNDYLIAIARYLAADDTLFNLVDGKINVNYPESEITKGLGQSATQTLIGVSFASRLSAGRLGAYTHKLKEVRPVIQIDVASLYGGNASYCEQVVDRIEDIVFYDIDYVLGGYTYHIFVENLKSTTYWDSEIKCWHGIISINGLYIRTAT